MTRKSTRQPKAVSVDHAGYRERVEAVERALQQGIPLRELEERLDRIDAAGYSERFCPPAQTSATSGK